MIRIVPTGDIGFDVILGGGWRLVERLEGKESATVVIRGGPGTGKTLLSVDAAYALAKALKGDVVVACVELLPTEFAAQIESGRSELSAITLPRTTILEDSEFPRIICGLLPELKEDAPDIVSGLEALEAEVTALNGKPRVFIVDSLIAGYGLGPASPRQNADAVMKFAASGGYGIVLCEETTDDIPTVWDFAADTVLALEQQREGGRQILVRKHRYGPSATGAHQFEIRGTSQPRIYPRPEAWLSGDHVRESLIERGWKFAATGPIPQLSWIEEPNDPPSQNYKSSFALVTGSDLESVVDLAHGLIRNGADPEKVISIFIDPTGPIDSSILLRIWTLPVAARVAATVREVLTYLGSRLFVGNEKQIPAGILFGDIGRLAAYGEPTKWAEGIAVIASLVVNSRSGVPLIVYDSSFTTAQGGTLASLRWHADLLIEECAGTDTWAIITREAGITETRRWPPAK